MIRCVLRDDPVHINIYDVWPVPAGTRLEAVIDALRALVVRHEALRTTFPHASGTAPCEQVVAGEGEFTVTVLDHAELPRTAPGTPPRWPAGPGPVVSGWTGSSRCVSPSSPRTALRPSPP